MYKYEIKYVTTYGKFTTVVQASSIQLARDKLVSQFNQENELTEITSVIRIE